MDDAVSSNLILFYCSDLLSDQDQSLIVLIDAELSAMGYRLLRLSSAEILANQVILDSSPESNSPMAILCFADVLDGLFIEQFIKDLSQLFELKQDVYQAAICHRCDEDVEAAFYQFGGIDVFRQPFLLDGLWVKINAYSRLRKQLNRAQSEMQEATSMALTAMSASSDLGLVIEFLKNTFDIEDIEGIAAYLISALSVYSEQVGVYIHSLDHDCYFSSSVDRYQFREQLEQSRMGGRVITTDDFVQVNQRDISVILFGVQVDGSSESGRMMDTLQMLMESAELCTSNVVRALLADRALESRTLFLSTMSHELRTPLNAISGFSRLLNKKTLGSDFKSNDIVAVESILRNAEALQQMVNSTLDVAAACANKLELQYSHVSLQSVMNAVQSRTQSLSPGDSLELIQGEECASLMLEADSNRLIEALIHLVTNGFKFNDRAGHVVLSVHVFEPEVAVLPAGMNMDVAGVLFTVTDDGIGIGEEAQAQLSYVMGQIDEAMDRRYSGIGLGLRYVAFIARYHHGQFAFESRLGEGSTFYLCVPLRASA